jgi:hypothetical protein
MKLFKAFLRLFKALFMELFKAFFMRFLKAFFEAFQSVFFFFQIHRKKQSSKAFHSTEFTQPLKIQFAE